MNGAWRSGKSSRIQCALYAEKPVKGVSSKANAYRNELAGIRRQLPTAWHHNASRTTYLLRALSDFISIHLTEQCVDLDSLTNISYPTVSMCPDSNSSGMYTPTSRAKMCTTNDLRATPSAQRAQNHGYPPNVAPTRCTNSNQRLKTPNPQRPLS